MTQKVFLLLMTLFFLNSCAIQKPQNKLDGIVYILPPEVQKLIKVKIQELDNPIYLVLESYKIGTYNIYIQPYNDETLEIHWIKNTNRKAFLGGKLYPIIFKSDEHFSTVVSTEKYLNSKDNDGNYEFSQLHIIRENVYHIEFTTKGKVLYEGY